MTHTLGSRAGSRAVTLIELIVVIVLAAIVTTAVVAGAGAVTNSRVRAATTLIISGIRVAYMRTSAIGRPMRLVLDLDRSVVLLEESSRPMLVRSDDKTTTGGAEASNETEKKAIDEAKRIVQGPQAPRAMFRPAKVFGFDADDPNLGRSLGGGVRIKRFEVMRNKEPQTTGRAYLYFWPGGTTERAAIAIGREDDPKAMLTIMVSGLTGRTAVLSGEVHLPEDRQDPTEREDRGY